MSFSYRRRRGLIAASATCLAFLTACGTRVGEAEVRAGAAANGPVTLSSSVLNQIRDAASTAAGSAGAAAPTAAGGQQGGAAAPSGSVVNPGATVLSNGVATGTTPAGRQPTAARPGGPAVAPGTGAAPAARPGKRAPGAVAPSATVPAKVAAKAACTGQEAPVNLGQIGSFTGIAGPITASARTAMAVWAKDVNARGGLACHPVVLYAQDDGADPSKSAALVNDLVKNKKAVALVGNFVVLSMSGFRSAIEASKVPVVGGDVLSVDWNDSPYMFPQGAGINSQINGLVRQSVEQGLPKLGLLYCVEASACTTAGKAVEQEAKNAGASLVYSSAISLTQTDFTAQCQNAKNAGVQALGLAMDGSAMGRVARSCAAIGYHPQFGASGLTISPAQANDPGLRKNTLATASVNAPWMLKDNEGLREYHRAMATYAPGLPPDGVSIAAWSSGKLLEAAIDNLGAEARNGPITTAMVMKGLGMIKKETLGGLAPPISFSPGQKAAPKIDCVYYELLTNKGWTAPRGSKPVCF